MTEFDEIARLQFLYKQEKYLEEQLSNLREELWDLEAKYPLNLARQKPIYVYARPLLFANLD